jgi:SAM-dependent methyltransferase
MAPDMVLTMDRAHASQIAHGDLPLMNPLSVAVLDEAIDMVQLPPAGHVLDVGCGPGEALLRVLTRHPSATGQGIDLHQQSIDEARARATERELPDRARFTAGDAGALAAADGPVDLALCLGSSHAFGGDWRTGLERMAALVRDGGEAIVGEGYWRREPDPAYLEALGATRDELPDYAGLVRGAIEAGWTPLHVAVTDEQDWDRYEWENVRNGERWAAANPGQDGDFVRDWVRRARDRYLAPGGRDTLGFALLVLRRDVAV